MSGLLWQPIENAPKDGTWILGVNNRGNQAVIIWDNHAPDAMGSFRAGWIHPFSDGRLSSFWNGGCGSAATHWMRLPAPPSVATIAVCGVKCEHVWDGPPVELAQGEHGMNGGTSTCSKCGEWAINVSMMEGH